MAELSQPTNQNRVAVIGRTGSGKTVWGIWFLGRQLVGPWAGMPVTIFDFKRDKLIAELPATEVSVKQKPPTKPGLYVVRPLPEVDDAYVKEYLMRIWEQENHGIFIDEGFMIGNRNPAFRALLTQGRSKNIPMIYLSQRPVFMDRFAFSEADYFAIFHLVDRQDVARVQEMISIPVNRKLAKHNCTWYDVGNDMGVVFSPCPDTDQILAGYDHLDAPRGKHML